MFDFHHRRGRRGVSGLALSAALLVVPLAGTAWGQTAPKTYAVAIPAENLAQALTDLSRQLDCQILFPYAAAARLSAPAVSGTLSRDEAVQRLLAGSALEIARETSATIALRVATDTAQTPGAATTEVIVTGTHIRGGNPTSPVHLVMRADIDASGYSEIGDVMRALPENFSGGQNPGVMGGASAASIQNQNPSGASTVNLRGFGTDATLVLLNGHRLPGDSLYQGADISAVPLAAVQRIEVVPDGASALYGSDAVAGVVNIILRNTYTGGELSALVGGTAQGQGDTRSLSLLQGAAGTNWHLLVNGDYARQAAITAADRDITSGMAPGNTLQPFLERRSLFVSAGSALNARTTLSLDALYSDRHMLALTQISSAASTYKSDVFTPELGLFGTLDIALTGDWNLKVSASDAGSRNSSWTTAPGYSQNTLYTNTVKALEVVDDGTLVTLPAGPLKAALGVGVRDEGFTYGHPGQSSYVDPDRQIRYLFGELQAPLVKPSSTRTGLHELEIDASGRYERYSDFGVHTNPKLGLRYVPFNDVTLRLTAGTSLKAPSFVQLYSTRIAVIVPVIYYGGTGSGAVLYTQGSNPNLKPERSSAWTAGLEWAPRRVRGLHLSATYFNITYQDRVVEPIAVISQGLSNPLYAPFVETSPSAASVARTLASANYVINPFGLSTTSITALMTDDYENASSQTARGVDLAYRQTFTLGGQALAVFANATTLRLAQRTISTAPKSVLSGTIFNAPSFKARAGISWQGRRLAANLILNDLSGETDTGVTPNATIGGWTTMDANLTYTVPATHGPAHGVRIGLAASNLFDKAPPFAPSAGVALPGLHYDSTNASAIGRTVSLSVTKAW